MIWRLTVLFLGLPLMFVGALYDGDDINVVVVLAWLGYLMLLIVVAASPISAWLLWRAESAADRSAGRTD